MEARYACLPYLLHNRWHFCSAAFEWHWLEAVHEKLEASVCEWLCKAQIPLGSSRHVSTRHDTFDVSRRECRASHVEPCCSTSSTQPKCMGSTHQSCRVETWRAKWNIGLSDIKRRMRKFFVDATYDSGRVLFFLGFYSSVCMVLLFCVFMIVHFYDYAALYVYNITYLVVVVQYSFLDSIMKGKYCLFLCCRLAVVDKSNSRHGSQSSQT